MAKSKTRTSRRRSRRGRATAGGHSSHLSMSAALPTLAFPADLLAAEGPEHTRVEVDLVVTSRDGSEVRRLRLRLTRRLRSGERIDMWGTDVDRLLQVNISSVAKGRWSFTARAIDERTNGQKLLGLLEFLDLLQPPYAVALAPPAQPARYLTKLERPAVSGIIPSLFREVVEAHAHVELALGVGIPVPDAYSGPQISRLLETATLLRGERVMNAWTSFRWTVTAAEARTLMDGVFREDGLALIELEQEWTLQLGNSSVDVGVVLATYEQARLVPLDLRRYGDGDQVELTVRAGISDAVTYRLIEVHGRPSKEPDQRWFWEDDWQRREREVDELVTAGEVRVHDGVDAFLDHLDNVAPE